MHRNATAPSLLPQSTKVKRTFIFLAYNADDPNSSQNHKDKLGENCNEIAPDGSKKKNCKTILLIEDQPGFRMIFRDALELAGYEVIEAEDGQLGWEKAKSHKPDLILLDLMLPKLHGFQVLQNIRAEDKTAHIPVLVLSVLDDKNSQEKGLKLGANGYIVKSHSPIQTVLNHVDEFLKKP